MDLSRKYNSLFHVSEMSDIKRFEPRPSPSYFEGITGDVVFAIAGRLLHNYLLPRDCPRVTWYAGSQTTISDKQRFIGTSSAEFFITVESGWYQCIKETNLYCYELPAESFTLLDTCAAYYISYQPVIPVSMTPVKDILAELLYRNIELRFTPSLTQLADDVSRSSLQFSIIRMRNAKR
jgi:hypothetical protein